eukprot:NODE_3802_length_1283_cov_119.481897_g3330_i0.p1 GENE.NODE_3802_length_1283_cov_119.481897_g3330_i0~~NODE_3802_length_1283_cov_119.481897_g3330_i0.p1  ORF type:complete len:321 (+),score=68.15 NODE_3802_length_1283_cov_119.481897_g3330_i0:72-1034(+)
MVQINSQLRKCLSRVNKKTLRQIALHFDPNFKSETHADLVDKNVNEVTQQGVDELISSLLEDNPPEKEKLLASCRKSEDELRTWMKSDMQGCIEKLNDNERAIIIAALDLQDSSPTAICEQIYINGLDAYLSDLLQNGKLEPLAKEMRIDPSSEDVVEQIIDQVFPPPEPEVNNSKKKEEKIKDQPKKKKEEKVREREESISPPPKRQQRDEKLPYDTKMEAVRQTRPPLQKGISVEDLQNYYWVDELKAFAKTNGLKCASKKSELNRAVWKFLNCGEVPVQKVKKPKPKAKPKKSSNPSNENEEKNEESEVVDAPGDAE